MTELYTEPDVIHIGQGRHGTSAMNKTLAKHPELYLPPKPGEPHFYDEVFPLTMHSEYEETAYEDYAQLFDSAGEDQVTVDFTAWMASQPWKVAWMMSAFEEAGRDVKTFCLLRDPVDFYVSMAKMTGDRIQRTRRWTRLPEDDEFIGYSSGGIPIEPKMRPMYNLYLDELDSFADPYYVFCEEMWDAGTIPLDLLEYFGVEPMELKLEEFHRGKYDVHFDERHIERLTEMYKPAVETVEDVVGRVPEQWREY